MENLSKSVLGMVLDQKFIENGFNATKKQSVETLIAGVKFIAEISLLALKSFQDQNLHKFDALVGENACQLRACKIVDLARKFLINTSFQKEVDKAIKCAEILFEASKKKIHPSNTKKTLEQFCEENDLKVFNMSGDLEFIVQSYLLTHTKVTEKVKTGVTYIDKTEVKKLEEFGFQKGKGTKIISFFQQKLALNSLIYLTEEGDELCPTKENILSKRRTKYLKKDSNRRLCSPCFYSFDVCLKRILEKEQSIVIAVERFNTKNEKVDTVRMLYKSNGKKFEIVNPSKFDLKEPVIIIEGPCIRENQNSLSEREFVEIFEQEDLCHILMANAAQHSLYPGKLKDIQIPNDPKKIDRKDLRLEALAQDSEEIGCSYKNPTLFLIEHIYAGTLESALKGDDK